jgi:ABC-type multidrug transport system permease subunit
MKIALQIAGKTLREMLREKQILIIIFLFPVLMIGMYAVAYGDTGAGLSSQLKVGILNGTAPTDSGATTLDQQLIQYLQSIELDGSKVFSLRNFNAKDTAITALREKQITALLILPEDINQHLPSPGDPIDLELIGDTYGPQFTFAQTFLLGAVEDFNLRLSVEITPVPTIQINYKFLEGTGTLSDLEFGLPGILVFGLMFLAMSTTQLLVREKSSKTLLRYRLSGVRPGSIFLGLMLSQLCIAVFLIPFSLASASLMGFHARGSIWPLLLISCILTVSAVGIGLIVACFTKNESEAINISACVVVPLVLLSNTLYPMEKNTLFSFFGLSFSVYDLLPTSIAADLLRNSLIYMKSLQELLPWVFWLLLQSMLIFLIGAWLFNHFLFRNQQA